jgi:CheY-like chemotaxis protein
LLRCEYAFALIAFGRARPAVTRREEFGSRESGCHGRNSPMAVILIVEDDGFLRDDAETMIKDWGHDILSAGDVDEALLLLRSPQQIDALFTDVYLKKAVLGGFELADQAIKLRLNLRVLYTTGNTINDKMKTLFVEGAHFLQKPYTRFQLQSSVEVLLAP